MLKFKIIANVIGIAIFFLTRFAVRTDKTKKPSGSYWIKSNWPELVIILLFDAGLMLIQIFGGITINYEKILPGLGEAATFTGEVACCFFIGLVLAYVIYMLYKVFIRKTN